MKHLSDAFRSVKDRLWFRCHRDKAFNYDSRYSLPGVIFLSHTSYNASEVDLSMCNDLSKALAIASITTSGLE